ncbi:hypothetical protein GCM10010254_49790 [Streptomyces chromofuscus]|nr:hypothetical protein GCM10010254_49790 [Streptomyces chromofuscus]
MRHNLAGRAGATQEDRLPGPKPNVPPVLVDAVAPGIPSENPINPFADESPPHGPCGSSTPSLAPVVSVRPPGRNRRKETDGHVRRTAFPSHRRPRAHPLTPATGRPRDALPATVDRSACRSGTGPVRPRVGTWTAMS